MRVHGVPAPAVMEGVDTLLLAKVGAAKRR